MLLKKFFFVFLNYKINLYFCVMKAPKKLPNKPTTKKQVDEDDDLEDDDIQTKKVKSHDEDEDDFDVPLDDLDNFDNFDDDDDDY